MKSQSVFASSSVEIWNHAVFVPQKNWNWEEPSFSQTASLFVLCPFLSSKVQLARNEKKETCLAHLWFLTIEFSSLKNALKHTHTHIHTLKFTFTWRTWHSSSIDKIIKNTNEDQGIKVEQSVKVLILHQCNWGWEKSWKKLIQIKPTTDRISRTWNKKQEGANNHHIIKHDPKARSWMIVCARVVWKLIKVWRRFSMEKVMDWKETLNGKGKLKNYRLQESP